MDFNPDTYQLIEAYLLGTLAGKARQDFEARLAAEPELAEEVRIHRRLYQHFNDEPLDQGTPDPEMEAFLRSDEAAAFKQQLHDTLHQHKQAQDTAPPRRIKAWRPLALAASVLLIVGFFYFFNKNSGTSPAQLYADNARHAPLALLDKGTEGELLADIQTAFNGGDYAEAAALLAPLLDTLPNSDPMWFDLRFSHGIALMEQGDTAGAEGIFSALRQADSINAPQAGWYAVLNYLKMDDRAKALEAARMHLDNGGGYKQAETQAIIKELE